MGLLIVLIFFQANFAQIRGANIEILTEGNVVQCGKQFTLTCKVEESSLLVAWMFDNDTVPIARCLSKSCDITTDYVGKYQLHYNVNEGFYNLTIMKLTIAEIGRTFVCTNGYESVSKTILFKDYRALLFEDAENGTITVSSGFISPDTKIVMKWTKIDADDNHESVFNAQLLYTTANMYSNVSLCSTNQLMQHSVTISAKRSSSGKHYLKTAVTYGNDTVISNITTLKYKVEEQDVNTRQGSDCPERGLLLFSSFTAVICIMVMVVACILFRKRLPYLLYEKCPCMLKSRDDKPTQEDNVLAPLEDKRATKDSDEGARNSSSIEMSYLPKCSVSVKEMQEEKKECIKHKVFLNRHKYQMNQSLGEECVFVNTDDEVGL